MDDEQGPWWTRPPEPGRVRVRDEERDASSGSSGASSDDEGSDPYDTELYRPGADDPTRTYPPPPAPDNQPPAEMPPADFVAPQNAAVTMELPMLGDGTALDAYGLPAAPQAPPAEATPSGVAPAGPKPAKAPIRRVAAPEPPKPPVKPAKPRRSVPEDRNAYAPPQNGDIWATFSGPIPLPDEVLAQQGRAPQTAKPARPAPAPAPAPEPAGGGDKSPLQQFLTVQVPEARFVLIGVAGGLVVLLIVLVALLSGRGSSPDETPTAAPETTTPSTALSGSDPKGLSNVKRVTASRLLQRAGVSAGGQIVSAFSWQDTNGKNLAVTIKVPNSRGKTTLKVIQVARLETKDPQVLRSMTDPDLPQCKSGRAGGQAGFAKNGLKIRDLDSDGTAEVMAGWSSRCGGATTASEAKLALVSDGDKYIIRGSGVVGGQTGSTAPAPAADSWPTGYYNTVAKLYAQLFFPVTK
ncbi:M949_RS01915 family surface polysaccharide biosynthesis protein [Kineosporia sp. NBRC 101731]|uniref:M949_RS01915 family surface polysaccharide biosynthesis protein n=1 Tax=Kineosporia sp. NBRC 101731 TaxID=3032199 RepID=UPI00249FD513|nr:hypothetical protein [Kineosporia sp. NBRC 101731]GLY26953.1 hypothetical protein Kisp02_03180 [Kineosporia sp. NBRC 101731]